MFGVVCLFCTHEHTRTDEAIAHYAQIRALEGVRQSLITSLGEIESQIAAARGDRLLPIAEFESQRRALIASLVKIDAEIAALRAEETSPPIVDDDEFADPEIS